jgi:hypothetical protein
MSDEADFHVEIPAPATHCAGCGAEYRHIQAPHKPAGVSMMIACDCVPVVTRVGSTSITRLVPPKQLEEEKRRETAIDKMKKALPFMRHAVKLAAADGAVHFGILSVRPDGSGTVMAKFEAAEFFDDLALIVGAPEQTKDDEMKAEAARILDNLVPGSEGLK